jgi:hypothetical protein
MGSKVNYSSTGPLGAFKSHSLPMLCIGLLAIAVGRVHALPNELHPPQREWAYRDHADVVTGHLYPAAFLMSRNVVKASGDATRMGQGYLSVGNYAKRPLEVTVAWDELLGSAARSICKPGGCELVVRFGAAAAMKFIAIQDKHSPTLILQDGRPLIGAAARHVGPIDVEVQTLRYGLVSMQFVTSSGLLIEKLNAPRK